MYCIGIFTMSAPSTTASQTDFCDAMSDVTSEPTSGCDTPIPRNRIFTETLNTLNEVSSKLEASVSGSSNPRKRKRVNEPQNLGPSKTEKYNDARGEYLVAAKPMYLRLKSLHKRRLSLASNIKVMEGKFFKTNILQV